MLNRRVLIAALSALAVGVWLSPGAAVGNLNATHKLSRHKVTETMKVINVGFLGKPGTSSFRAIKAGTIDGWIGKTRIHGALRGLRKIVGSEEILQGTEFDSGGSRSFVVHQRIHISNGQAVDSGTGKWTGGTGAYKDARGTFTESGGGPLDGVHTVHVKGSITF